jgi:putative radical SAM enzyme (TIGR03279 family)
METALINKADLEQTRVFDPNAEKDIKFVSAPAYISSVPPWSLAHEIGLKQGDLILEINGHKLRDFFDFNFHFTQSEEILLLVRREKEEFEIELEKDIEEELGAEFHTPLFNGVQECANKCPFCFVENQPFDQTRETLQLRDDDFRLSYLHGSYVTLTNLSFSDRKRIETLRPGPLYVSVHATEPEVRNLMLGRKKSIPILEELKWLASLDIPVHTQIVLCPEMNDGKHLLQTINDLFELKDSPVVSVAVVPVGLTKYHRAGLRRFTFDEALDVVNMVENWEGENPKHKNFVFLSDEFYLMTHSPIPGPDYYGDYPQLEDGVGMTRLFLSEIDIELKKIKTKKLSQNNKTYSWINGTISKPIVEKVAERINNTIAGVNLKPICVDSQFWGTTNVSGLLTGNDIYTALKYIPKDILGDAVIIPKVMLKDKEDIFLDDMHISELESKLGVKCVKAWGAAELIEFVKLV